MKHVTKMMPIFLILSVLLVSVRPCGPAVVMPLFDLGSRPEVPYRDYAAGKLGIIKPEFQRPVLIAAYRYIASSGLSRDEQKAIIEAWNAEFHRKDFRNDSVDEAVRNWIAKRKAVVDEKEPLPKIYTEREYGGFDFFPNCAKNAFEVAAETLSDRLSAHGPSDPNVREWISGQDKVFENCSAGRAEPTDTDPGAPQWLVKDRAYQQAAADFYALNYEAAKAKFRAIAQDSDSPWQETADYLVARTLIRQASLGTSEMETRRFYEEAELQLTRFTSRSGKFRDSVAGLLNLIKYRLRPAERVVELGRQISSYGGNDNFRQDVIDYTWLLDRFEAEVLNAVEKRKAEEERLRNGTPKGEPTPEASRLEDPNTITIRLYTPERTIEVKLPADATDDDAIAAVTREAGKPLTDEQKQNVRDNRQYAFASRFSNARKPDYTGRYYGDEKMDPSMLPDHLRSVEMTEWLFVYRMSGPAAYNFAMQRYADSGSELWLMTALTKAEPSSPGLTRLLEAAERVGRSSPAFLTVSYYRAKLLLDLKKDAAAREVVEEAMNSGEQLTISARNAFLGLRLRQSADLDAFIRNSLRRAYAFDFDGQEGTIADFIAEQKTYYDPEYNKDGREAFDREVEERFKEELLWQDREMLDASTIAILNQHFTTTMLIEAAASKEMPEYLADQILRAAWVRAYLLNDRANLIKLGPELVRMRPDMAPLIEAANSAATPVLRDRALLFAVLKNPILSPYIEEGLERSNNTQEEWDMDDWWCAPDDMVYDEASGEAVKAPLPNRPPFITPAKSAAAQAERKKLTDIGDAPKYLAEKVLAWQRLAPADKRLPEALYIVARANGWTKYGCGNNEELRARLIAILKRTYPASEWTKKLIAEEAEN
ncbi:MAG: hypothetical protein KF736_08085 [Acidobacteria bacterium]|nr:hypothetical protein [Acidobacteriota bacterium]MCW5948919.1 hypothetical protein [Pyrinomonadaceae bacterium]